MATELTLDELPDEILLLIFAHLTPKCVLLVVSLVCKKFYALTSNDNYWRRRLASVGLTYSNSCISSNNFTFQKACVLTEHEYWKWSRYRETLDYRILSAGHYASVDAVHLLENNNLCISGSRDRNLCLWDLRKLDEEDSSESQIFLQHAAHNGWIWAISSVNDSNVFTGSWDQTVNEWQLKPEGLSSVLRMRCTTAVLCVKAEMDLVLAGTFGARIVVFDRRAGGQILRTLNDHTRAVLSLAVDNNYLYSCSEDKCVYCFDRRNWQVICRTRLDNYGHSLSLSDGQLIVSDNGGNFHLFDARSESFGVLSSVNVGGKRRVTDVKHNLGSIICLSADKFLRAYSNSLSPQNFACVELPSEPTKLSIKNGAVACGFTDGTVGLWRQKPFEV